MTYLPWMIELLHENCAFISQKAFLMRRLSKLCKTVFLLFSFRAEARVVAVNLIPGLPAYILFMCIRHADYLNDDQKVKVVANINN